MKTYVVGTHSKRLAEVLLMSTHNIYFHEEIPSYSSGAMNKYLEEGLIKSEYISSKNWL